MMATLSARLSRQQRLGPAAASGRTTAGGAPARPLRRCIARANSTVDDRHDGLQRVESFRLRQQPNTERQQSTASPAPLPLSTPTPSIPVRPAAPTNPTSSNSSSSSGSATRVTAQGLRTLLASVGDPARIHLTPCPPVKAHRGGYCSLEVQHLGSSQQIILDGACELKFKIYALLQGGPADTTNTANSSSSRSSSSSSAQQHTTTRTPGPAADTNTPQPQPHTAAAAAAADATVTETGGAAAAPGSGALALAAAGMLAAKARFGAAAAAGAAAALKAAVPDSGHQRDSSSSSGPALLGADGVPLTAGAFAFLCASSSSSTDRASSSSNRDVPVVFAGDGSVLTAGAVAFLAARAA